MKTTTNTTTSEIKDTNNNNNNSTIFIASPKGTKPFPFQKKVRTIAKRNKIKLITILHEICHLLKIEDKTNLNIYCEIENDRIIIEKLSLWPGENFYLTGILSKLSTKFSSQHIGGKRYIQVKRENEIHD